MVIYADILIFVNTIIDYFLLRLTAKICRSDFKEIRLIAGAFTGGLFSLYILIPQSNVITEFAARIAFCLLMSFVAFGFRSFRKILREFILLFSVSFLYAGFMYSIWYVFKPNGIVINNGVVYFDVSPLFLIVVAAVCYILISVVMAIINRRKIKAAECDIQIECGTKSVNARALLDTGHRLTDEITGSAVIIVDKAVGERLFGHITVNTPIMSDGDYSGFRVIPYKTIDSEGILPAFRCEKMIANHEGSTYKISSPVVAVLDRKITDECNAIINPQIFMEGSL